MRLREQEYIFPALRMIILLILHFEIYQANAIDVPENELTERFVRGDLSRTTEGSGLGLSIAKNLTEIQGGRFRINTDADLFKVTLTFASGKAELQDIGAKPQSEIKFFPDKSGYSNR